MTRYVEKIKGEKVLLSLCPTLRLLFEKRMQKVWVLFFHLYFSNTTIYENIAI